MERLDSPFTPKENTISQVRPDHRKSLANKAIKKDFIPGKNQDILITLKKLEPNIVNCLTEQTHEGIKWYVMTAINAVYSKAEKNKDRATVEKTQIYA